MSKWNEKLVINFLKQYKQHPCLWNPYHKNYYNCQAKNEALQKISDNLGTPGFTVTDYLHQIKIIREKYKREQTRTIKGLQLQKHYKSPFPWYNIVADMLTKVISDEEKMNSQSILNKERHDALVLKSLSCDNIQDSQRKETKSLRIRPCTDATCNEVSRRSKSAEKSIRSSVKLNTKSDKVDESRGKVQVKYVPCPQVRITENISRDQEEDDVSSYKPTRDIESRERGYSITAPCVSIDTTLDDLVRESKKSNGAGFLQCPFCGWEDAKYKQIKRNVEKSMQEQRNYIPCSNYNSDPSGVGYAICTGCDRDVINHPDYPKNRTDDSGDYEISRDTPKEIFCREFYRPLVKPMVPKKKDVDVEIQVDTEAKEVSKDYASARSPVQTQIVRFDPEITSKFQDGTIEACTRLKIILLDSKGNSRDNEFTKQSTFLNIQDDQHKRPPESSTKETQFSSENIFPASKIDDTSDNAVNCVKGKVKNTVCVMKEIKHCVSLQTLNEINEKEKQKDQSTRGDLVCSMESKEIEANIIDRVSKGTQSKICASKGNLTHCLSFEKMKDTGTTFSIHEIHNNICILPENLRENETNFVSCITKLHEDKKSCMHQENLKETTEKGIQEYEDPCKTDTCLCNLFQIIKEDSSVALALQQLLTKMLSQKSERGTQSTKSSEISNDCEYKCNEKENCTLDILKIINKIKEHAIKTLGSNTETLSKDKIKEISEKINGSMILQETEDKQVLAEAEGYYKSTNRLTTTTKNDPKPTFESTRIEDKTVRISKDETMLLQDAKKLPVIDKEVSTYSESRDVGTNGSFSQLLAHDIGTQNGLKLMDDSVFSAKLGKNKQGRMSVGTQKRDPILVRVIKCNESQAVMKSDKETLTMEADIRLEKKYIDKRIETCGRLTCIPNIICKQSKGENLEFALQKEREKQVDRIRALKHFTCDATCRDKAYCESDWTDITNVDPFRNFNYSKIPLCVRSRKCTYERNK